MNKLEITIKADELVEAITRLINTLENCNGEVADNTGTDDSQDTIAVEQIRAVLAKKAQAGKQAEVRKLITSYDANKLTEIDEARYTDLLKEAEKL